MEIKYKIRHRVKDYPVNQYRSNKDGKPQRYGYVIESTGSVNIIDGVLVGLQRNTYTDEGELGIPVFHLCTTNFLKETRNEVFRLKVLGGQYIMQYTVFL